MNTISTRIFDFRSPARPEQVWTAATEPTLTARYLFGLAAESTWELGTPVTFRPTGSGPMDVTLEGEVLIAEHPRRLSYSVGSGGSHPTAYVTWQISEGEGTDGSRVRLYVDETQTTSDRDLDPEAETAWAAVVSSLQRVLAGLPLGGKSAA